MLSFIRRIINSKAGLIVTFIVLGLVAVMFGLGDVSGLRNGNLGKDSVASVGREDVPAADLRQRVQNAWQNARQQQPTLDMVQFVAAGGVDNTLEGIINTNALSQYARMQGMVASTRLVDGRIASIPSVQGVDGKFSQTAYDQLLASQHLSDKQIHEEVARDTLTQHLLDPTFGATQVPLGVAQPYASLLLEKRNGEIGFIDTPAMGKGAAPSDAELATFYKRNIARYTVPERRLIRYAIVTPDQMKAAVTPTDAEIAQAYQASRAKYAPTEKRDLVQVVIADQAAANALAAKVKAGTPIDAATRAIGLEPNVLKAVEKSTYAAQSSPEIANAAFSAAKGAVIGPVRSALGYTVVRVDGIQQIAGKSLEQARPELVTALTAQKTLIAMSNAHDKIDDAIGNRATFDELVRDQKLEAKLSPPLLSNGVNPDDPNSKPDPAFAQVLAAAFGAEKGDEPQIVPFGQGGNSFAIVSLSDIVPAAPRKLADIHDKVASDFVIDRAQRAARQTAIDVVARVNKGMPLAQSLAATRLQLPPSKPIPDVTRLQLANVPRGTPPPPPLVMLFSMKEKTARMLEAPNKAGWYIVYLNHIERGDASKQPGLIDQTRSDLGKAMGQEYAAQFGEAVRRVVGVKKNAKAIADMKAALTGQGGSN
ncbi:peptidyl-prolyl cis-trans isomerase [Sphingomonas oligophenolica]|uniref:Parvulin-like PPIase n=1 Tax=Sphingomonas oligophenolica TaxID=301154 RepID=A0ABU9Y7L3_9SPHN